MRIHTLTCQYIHKRARRYTRNRCLLIVLWSRQYPIRRVKTETGWNIGRTHQNAPTYLSVCQLSSRCKENFGGDHLWTSLIPHIYFIPPPAFETSSKWNWERKIECWTLNRADWRTRAGGSKTSNWTHSRYFNNPFQTLLREADPK